MWKENPEIRKYKYIQKRVIQIGSQPHLAYSGSTDPNTLAIQVTIQLFLCTVLQQYRLPYNTQHSYQSNYNTQRSNNANYNAMPNLW